MPYVCVVEFIRAEPSAVYKLFRDPRTFPDFMPNVHKVELAEEGDHWSVSEWLTDLDGAPLEWREIDNYDDANHVVQFRLLDGDITKFEGRWAFEPCDEGTMCKSELEYELGVSIIEDVVGPVIRQKVENNIRSMLLAVKGRLEGVQAATPEEAPCPRSSR